MTIKENLKINKFIIISCLVFIIYTLTSFGFYYERTLQGNIDNHILSAEFFGIPQALKDRRIKPLYHGSAPAGWDGQFYYYMSNDVLAKKDTSKHIDAPSYRYQRIGLSLYAATIAKLLGLNWVSPTVFFVSYFFLLISATWIGASIFTQILSSPALILLWSLGVGTQITLFNALPDAAADAFLILALGALFNKKYLLSVIPFVLSALSREVYAIFPSLIFLFYLIDSVTCHDMKNETWRKKAMDCLKWKFYYLLLIPGLIAVLWHVYVTLHFGVAPSEQATGIIGLPLASWFNYFQSGVHGNHLLVGQGFSAQAETVSLLFFLVILIFSFLVSANILIRKYQLVPVLIRGISAAALIIVLLYSCFGPTVMMHYTGYFKALGVFFFLLPLLLFAGKFSKKIKIAAIVLLISALAYTTYYNMVIRFLPKNNLDKYTKISTITKNDRIECFGEYNASIEIKKITLQNNNVFTGLFSGDKNRMIIRVLLKNTGHHPFISSQNFGSVFMSSHWIDRKKTVVIDGIRSALPGELLPGQSALIDVVTHTPTKFGQYFLKLSPVQEGCAWFYRENPDVSPTMQFVVGEFSSN